MAVTTFTWNTGTAGQWTVASNWNPGTIPNSPAAAVVIGAAGVGGSNYTVTLAAGATEQVNSLTIGNLSLGAGEPTLEVAGTLQLVGSDATTSFLQGALIIDNSGVLDGEGLLGATSIPGIPFTFENFGVLHADAGANTALAVLSGFSNIGTVLADNGSVEIEGSAGISNLSGSVLTGGTYIVQGPTAGTFNQILFGFNFDANLAVDAATIILDGSATAIDGYAGGNFVPLEQQLQTVAVGGDLELRSGRGFLATNALTDNGAIILQGGTLATAGLTVATVGTSVGGFLQGFGIVQGPVSNSGFIIATGGVLDVQAPVSGAGELSVASGGTMVLQGGTPATVLNSGTLYQTSGLLQIGTLGLSGGGSGTLVVQNGATIELQGSVASTQNVVFAGSDATLRLDSPATFHGTLSGLALGDQLILAGVTADSAHMVGNNTLAVISGGSTIDTFTLGDSVPSATYSVTSVAGGVAVQNTAGGPGRQNFQFNISLNDSAGLSNTQETQIVNVLSAATDDWAQYITGHTTLRISLNITSVSTKGSELADAGFADVAQEVVNGQTVLIPSSIYALTTGQYVPGSTADINVNLPLLAGELSGSAGGLYVNPNPFTSGGTVPAGLFDLLTVFRHEMAHGLGFAGETTQQGALNTAPTPFDQFIQDTVSAGTITAANFIGPNAEAAYGVILGTGTATPVPLTLLNNGENFFHLANSSGEPLGHDLMNGIGLLPGTSVDISAMDLAILSDVGAPVTAGVICFARGTRIATPTGEVPVEMLAAGDTVLSESGEAVPIVWVGHRRVSCHRHPEPASVWPIRIQAHAVAPDLPRRDLFVSPQHALFFDGMLIPAWCLVNGSTIAQVQLRSVEYFHVELPRHDLLLAEGLPSESYLDCGNRGQFDNGSGPIALHPDFARRAWEGSACAALVCSGPVVDSVRRRLAERAASLAGASAAAA